MEDIIICHNCGHKFVKSTLYKTRGHCPRCGTLLSKSIKADTEEATPQPVKKVAEGVY